MRDAAALALVHFLWQGAALALVAAVLMRIARRSAQARYAIGVATLCAMAAAPVVTTAWFFQAPGTTVVIDGPVSHSAAGTVDTLQTDRIVASEVASSQPPDASVFPYSTVVLIVWAIGVLVLSARLAGGWLIAHRLATRSVAPVVEEVQQTARRLAARLRLSRPVRILESSAVAVPLMIGWLKPVVLLPTAAIAGLAPDQLEALIAHELAHVRRHDYLVNLLQSLVETMLFYHPAVWWMSHRVRQDREHCCDDLAVGVTDRLTYVTALSHVASLTAPGVALAATDGSLRGRVRRLLGPERDRRSGGAWLAMLPLVLVIAAVSPMAGRAAAEIPQPPAPTAITVPEIISPETPAVAVSKSSSQAITTDRTPLAPAPKPAQTAPTVAPGDRLHIEFIGIPRDDADMDGVYPVSAEGVIDVKYVGGIVVSGLTTTQAQMRIQTLLEERKLFARGKVAPAVTLEGRPATPSQPVVPLPLGADTIIAVGNVSLAQAPPAPPAPVPQPPAQVKPGETIVINVEGRPELSGTYVVQPDGTIKLKGVTPDVIEVQVGGAVRAPGVVRLEDNRSVVRAIVMAGGFTPYAGPEVEVLRRRPGGNVITIVLTREQLESNDALPLQAGDRVNVKLGRVFHVNGEVNAKGEKPWALGLTVGRALVLGGGQTDRFSLARSHIQRPVKDGAGQVLKYEKVRGLKLDTPILPDDTLVAGRKLM